ncbi:hypothetical protein, partial [Myxococcus xanthus]
GGGGHLRSPESLGSGWFAAALLTKGLWEKGGQKFPPHFLIHFFAPAAGISLPKRRTVLVEKPITV